mgnify:CR=1 FL=1
MRSVRRAPRRKYTPEEKIRIVLEGLRGEIPITELCRQQGIQPSIYYKWSKALLDAGKNGLTRDTQRDATFQEVRRLKEENDALKRAVAEMVLDNQRLKKVWACKAQEVSANGWRIQTGSSTSRGGLRAAGNTSAGSASDTPLDLLPVASELSSTRSARLARSSIFPQPGVWTRYCHQSETKRWRLPCCIRSGRHEKSAGILRTTAGLRSPSPRSIGS